MKRLSRIYFVVSFFFSWVVFGGVGLALNLICAPLLLVPGRSRLEGAVRRVIRWLFGAWCQWLHAMRLVFVTWNGFTPEALAGPAVYVSNHPGLIDATLLLSRLPNAICIFKPALIRNPAIGPAAIMAGYAAGTSGVDLIRDVAERVAAGRSLLVFPEGRRTPRDQTLGAIKPGFALIASRAHVPIRVIAIRAPRDLLPRGHCLWHPPIFPARVEITLLGQLDPDETLHTAELTARATAQLSAALVSS
jgi:1-acyl-sn-glycerol-3-phosphate acyltransferase